MSIHSASFFSRKLKNLDIFLDSDGYFVLKSLNPKSTSTRSSKMKRIFFVLITTILLSLAVTAQTNSNSATQSNTAQTVSKPKKQIFRANKGQVIEAQKMMNATESGKLDKATRAAIKTYQGANGLKATGTLNRATLEKMNITLTAKQKETPVSPNSYAAAKSETKKSSGAKSRGAVFCATKDQIMQAQKMMKEKSMYLR